MYTPDGVVHKWGYQLKFPDQPIAWFKLLLFPSMYSSADSSMISKALSLPSGKKPVVIVADYLSCLRLHFLEIISGRIGKACMDATPIEYTMTVPAVPLPPHRARFLTLLTAITDLERFSKVNDARGSRESGTGPAEHHPADVRARGSGSLDYPTGDHPG